MENKINKIKCKRILNCVYCGKVIGTTLEWKDTICENGYCVCNDCGTKQMEDKE